MSPYEINIFNEIKAFLGDTENKDAGYIAPFPLLTRNAVESLRYRVEVSTLALDKIKQVLFAFV